MMKIPPTKGIHPDWSGVQDIETLIRGMVSNCSGLYGVNAKAIEQDLRDILTRAIDISNFEAKQKVLKV